MNTDKVMTIGRGVISVCEVGVDRRQLVGVSEFKYLGFVLNESDT